MNHLVDNSLVGLALLLSAGYALSTLGPRSLRRRLFGALGWLAARTPPFLHLGRMARWLEAKSGADAQGACGGCGSCASEQAAPNAGETEVRVPVAKIGRR